MLQVNICVWTALTADCLDGFTFDLSALAHVCSRMCLCRGPGNSGCFSDSVDEGACRVLSRAAMDAVRRSLFVRMAEVPRRNDLSASLDNSSTVECALGGNLDADEAIPAILGTNLAVWLVRLYVLYVKTELHHLSISICYLLHTGSILFMQSLHVYHI